MLLKGILVQDIIAGKSVCVHKSCLAEMEPSHIIEGKEPNTTLESTQAVICPVCNNEVKTQED